MPDPIESFQFSDLQALAVLANAKLAPAVPYAFTAFAGKDQITTPDFTATPAYGIGAFTDGQEVPFELYAYKTIGGLKTYTYIPLRKAFKGAEGSGVFSLTWTWVSPVDATAPEGYIIVIIRGGLGAFEYAWQDIGAVETFTEDGSFSNPAWKYDRTLDAANLGFPAQNLPCGRGTWLKTLNQIHHDFFTGLNLYGGARAFTEAMLISGPWCVSVGPKCYLQLSGASLPANIYKNLKFVYSEDDSPTGNEIAPEADMLAFYFGGITGANPYNFGVDGVINGTITLFSNPFGQATSDWILSATPATGITSEVVPNYDDEHLGREVTAMVFTLREVPYTVGTPLVLTATPTAGGSIINDFTGARLDIVFTGAADVYGTAETTLIHPAGPEGKSVDLPNTLADIQFITGMGTSNFAAHYKTNCPGVFIANTLPTLGIMNFLDVDLPQYSPQHIPTDSPSSRRTPRNAALPYLPVFADRGALWPVFRDTKFTPDDVAGKPITGSIAWRALATKHIHPVTFTDPIDPYEPAENLFGYSLFVPLGAADVRFYANDPAVTLYAKLGGFPTLADFDASAPGGTWLSLAAAVPGFTTDTFWYYAIYNPTAGILTVATTAIVIPVGGPPNGTFFPTGEDDAGQPVPQKEGFSYRFSDPQTVDERPIPLYGYCVTRLTVRRQPFDNTSAVAISPTTGTADLAVKIGLMKEFGFESAGVFTEMLTVTIPAGQAFVRVEVFWPVAGGTFLAYQCAETIAIMADVNFQPMLHSTFSRATAKVNGGDYPIGYYNGPAWYQKERALLFFKGGDSAQPQILPIAAAIYNDLTAILNLI